MSNLAKNLNPKTENEGNYRWMDLRFFPIVTLVHKTPYVVITNTRFAWAGGTFFLVVLYVVSVFGSGGKNVLVQIRIYYLEYNTVVVVR